MKKAEKYGEPYSMSISMAAFKLNCHPSQVRYLIKKGELATFTHIGQTRKKIITESIHEYINGVNNVNS